MISLGNWSVDYGHPVLVILTVMLIVSCFFSLRAAGNRLFHRNRTRALLVMVLNLLAFLSLLILLMQPLSRHQAEQTVMLLTEGFDPESLVFPAGTNVYRYSQTPASETKHLPTNVITLSHIAQLNLKEPALNKIQIKGFGLSETDWKNFNSEIEVEFQAPLSSGFVDMRWARSLSLGETFTVNGSYQPSTPDAVVEIQLLDPTGAIVDGARIIGSKAFKLNASPKVLGDIKYSLQAVKADKVQTRQPVPVSVKPSAPITIMIQQSAPSFETRQLKDYASISGHRVLINTVISKGKSISQKSNLPETIENGLSPQTLAMTDVLIMDGRALNALDGSTRQWLQDAIISGLGLLVIADSSLLESSLELQNGILSGFKLEQDADAETRNIPRLLTDKSIIWQSTLPTRSLSLNGSDADTLIDNGFGRSLVSTRATGLGNVGVTLIAHSNQWLTSGNRADWGKLWSSIFESLARQAESNQLLTQAHSDIYRLNQKTAICALGRDGLMRVRITTAKSGKSLELDMSKDVLQSGRQCAFFWPLTDGWHKIELLAEETGGVLDKDSIYVFQEDHWKTQDQYNRARATIARANNTQNKQAEQNKWVSEPMGIIWPWLIFLFAASLLWLERKLDWSEPGPVN